MKKFNVGIVGYGWAATAHLPAINAGALGQVTRICSSRSLNARELSAKHDCAPQTTTDYAALLADPDIQVVSICSYHHQHKEQAILENRESSNSAALGLQSQRVLAACYESAQTDRAIQLTSLLT